MLTENIADFWTTTNRFFFEETFDGPIGVADLIISRF
jgi:hypothetical protein